MPTFEEMQRESSERLVSFAKHAKLSVRSALLDTDGPIDVYSEKSYRELANVMVTDFIPLGVHKLQGNGINLLAKDVRENAEKVSSILDGSIHEEKGIVDKRREAMVIVNDVMSIDGLTQWHINGVAEKLSALQDDRRVTRSTFTPERARMLIEATDGFLMSVQNRVIGMSTLYADDRVDNVAAFHDTASIDNEMTRLDKERFRGASDTQRKLWQHDVEEPDMGSSDSSHFWSRSGSESLDHWSPGRSDLDSNRPSSGASSPRSIGSRSDHGGASRRSGDSSGAPHESPRSESWAGVSPSAASGSTASDRSSRSGVNRDVASPSPGSDSSAERDYVVRRWPGPGQGSGIRAFRSGDREAALTAARELYGSPNGRSGSPDVIPETREGSPVDGTEPSPQQTPQRNLKRGRSETSEEGGSGEASNKRQQLIDGRAGSPSASRGL